MLTRISAELAVWSAQTARRPLLQLFLALTLLFFAFQAPDVALSEIVVSTVGLPLIILLALRKIREQEHSREQEEGEPRE